MRMTRTSRGTCHSDFVPMQKLPTSAAQHSAEIFGEREILKERPMKLIPSSLMTPVTRAASLVGGLLVFGACTGSIDSDATAGANGGLPTPTGPDGPTIIPDGNGGTIDCSTPTVGPSPLRRLTATEYDNAVADLLNDTSKPATTFPADNRVGVFDNTATVQTVPVLLAEKYLNTAAALAEGVSNISTLTGCTLSSGDARNCVGDFIGRFGRRAFRRPLQQTEVDTLLQIFDSTSAQSDAETGVRGVLTAMLVSPHFLFRPEFGVGPSAIAGAQQLSPWELSARLGSLLWASLPDDTLLDAAAAGQLSTREQVAAQAQRMLADPRAKAVTESFYAQWLGMERLFTTAKDEGIFPEFDNDLRNDMQEETMRFIDDVVWEGDSKVSTLFAGQYSFMNGRLADLYGMPNGGNDSTFSRVALNSSERAGFLTQASFLTALSSPTESSPFKRGAWVRTRLLCQDLPEPPAEVPELPEPQDGVSNRQRAATHSTAPACSGCHSLIDGLGFGLEQYDAIGRVRTIDRGVPVDTSGEVTKTADIDGPFNGGAELATRLAGSAEVRDCVATQWLRYSLARRETPEDACSVHSLHQAFAASDGNLQQLLVDLTQTDLFWSYRPPSEAQ